MFGKVIASAAVAIALLVPSGTASAHWDRDFYQNYIEHILKQYDIQVYYKDFEKIAWKKAAPANAEKTTEPETEVPVEKESAQNPEQPAAQAPETNIEAEAPAEEVQAPAEEVQEPAEEVQAPVEENAEPEVEPVAQTTQNEASADELGSFEAQVIELTNQERSKYGLPALQADTELSAVAEEKSADMARNQYFSHTSPTYGSPFDMMKSYGIDYRSAGENIAMGQRTPEQVVNAWMNSEGHRQNILSTSYTHIGVGYVENGNYWTQMFIGK